MIEKAARGDKESIVVTEIPYQVNKARLIERIAELVNDKKHRGHRRPARRVRPRGHAHRRRAEARRDRAGRPEPALQADADAVAFGIIFLAIVDNQPRVLPLHELLRHFIDHRKAVVIRRTQFDLRKAEERAHILRGLALALRTSTTSSRSSAAPRTPRRPRSA